MKQYLIFGIFLFVASKKKTTAKEIADAFEISSRTVYRYIDTLSMAGVPFVAESGKNGGIHISPDFCLENFVLTKSEKDILKQSFTNNQLEAKKIIDKICV